MDLKPLKKKALSRGIGTEIGGGYERHVLLCAGLTEGGCCVRAEGERTWEHLCRRLSKLRKGGRSVYLTQAECLMFCKGGPLMVVYPEGTWYGGVTPEVCDHIVEGHLVGGEPVTEYAFAQNPLRVAEDQPES